MSIVAIRSCGKEGNKTLSFMKKQFGEESTEYVFVDVDSAKWYTKINGIEVISINDFLIKYRKKEIDCIVFPEVIYSRKNVDELIRGGCDTEDIYVYNLGSKKIIKHSSFTYLYYLEYHVVDHCNLNCKCCDHFSPLVAGEVFTHYTDWEADIKRLHELIEEIHLIRIMGGDPLLNKELPLYIRKTRELYPVAQIHIVTNGILLSQQSDYFWQSMIDNQAEIHLSVYPDLANNTKILFDLCENKGVKIHAHDVTGFIPLIRKNKKPYCFENTSDCICNNLYQGYISSCPYPMYGKYFNRYFDENIPFDSGKINIYDKSLTGRTLMERLDKPTEICNYCRYPELFINQPIEMPAWEHYSPKEEKKKTDFCLYE